METVHPDATLCFGVPVTLDYIERILKDAISNLLYLRRQIPAPLSDLEKTISVCSI